MLAEAKRHLAALAGCVSGIEPAALDADTAREVLELGCAMKRLGAGLELLVSSRAVRGAPWREEGHRSEAGWLAEAVRSSVPDAVAAMAMSECLENLPATTEALSKGELSTTEAKVLVSAASADPASEAELLEAARSLPMGEFCHYARDVAHAAHERDPDHRQRLRRRRFLRFWTDTDGTTRFSGGVTPDAGVALVSAVRSQAEHLLDEARRAGTEQEPAEARAADALVSLACGELRRATFDGPQGSCSGGHRTTILHVNLESLRRGGLEVGELCEIPGVGPVPLEVAESLMVDGILKLVIEDGVDISTVVHLGRAVPAHLETALVARDRTCVVPGCQVEFGLEIDHWQVPFADGGPTVLWNLARICVMHHRMKTYEGFRLLGGPGKWEWRPPD